jgi:hypothetical protein
MTGVLSNALVAFSFLLRSKAMSMAERRAFLMKPPVNSNFIARAEKSTSSETSIRLTDPDPVVGIRTAGAEATEAVVLSLL